MSILILDVNDYDSHNLAESLGLRTVAMMNYIIVTEDESFYYFKNRYNGITNKNFPLKDLPSHISCITFYINAYKKLDEIMQM